MKIPFKGNLGGHLVQLLMAPIVISLIAIIALLTLFYTTERSRHAQIQLARVDAALNLVSSNEWEAIYDHKITDAELKSIADRQLEIVELISDIRRLRFEDEVWEIDRDCRLYNAAMKRELFLLREGKVEQARNIDEEDV